MARVFGSGSGSYRRRPNAWWMWAVGPGWRVGAADRAPEPMRLDGIDKIVLGLYEKGMSTSDITAHLAEI